jgi:hypothetical protein
MPTPAPDVASKVLVGPGTARRKQAAVTKLAKFMLDRNRLPAGAY